MSVIRQLHDSILTINGTLSYDEVTDLFLKLPEAVEHFEEFDWTTNLGFCSVDELIVGAYWHYTEWHNGQYSPGYAALSALGTIFSPGMEELDIDNAVYLELLKMAFRQLTDRADEVDSTSYNALIQQDLTDEEFVRELRNIIKLKA